MTDFTIRTMTEADLPAVGELAGRLVNLHHELDSKRFMALPNAAVGYARYFASERKNEDAVLIVAEKAKTIIGYAYGRIEPRSYNELRDECGALHDVYVDEGARATGAGEALVREIIDRLGKKGAPRVILLTAVQNESAQRLFTKLGFRTTMLEMTREM